VERPTRAPTPVPGPLALPAGGAVLVQAPGGLWIVDADGDRQRLGRWDDAAWSASGRFVAAVHGQRLAALDRRGHVRWSLTRPFQLAQPAWSLDGLHVAYRSANGLRVVAGDGTAERFVAGGLGPARPAWQPGPRAIVALVYSPLGGWLMVAWRGADEWVFLRAPGVDRVKAVGDVTRRVDPRLRSYPRVLGWCCPP
jgi:hypothetical protein